PAKTLAKFMDKIKGKEQADNEPPKKRPKLIRVSPNVIVKEEYSLFESDFLISLHQFSCTSPEKEKEKKLALFKNLKLYQDDESLFKNILNEMIDKSHLINTISHLSHHLHEYFGKKNIILIDEYDWAMKRAKNFTMKRIFLSSACSLV
ncbi:15588_t:CDS:2, partial [Cetraspora pellucida]